MFISNNRPGQAPFEGKRLRVVNRCGSTDLNVGDVVALDLGASDSETQALNGVGGVGLDEIEQAVFHNIVHVGAHPANALVAVVTSLLSGGGKDDTEVEVQISGRVAARVGGTNWSSAHSSNGVALMADTTGANRRFVAAADAANRGKQGVILSNVATDLSSDTAVHEVLLMGWGNLVGPVSG